MSIESTDFGNAVAGFVVGVLVGVTLMGFASRAYPDLEVAKYKAAIELCEKDLPRNQTCVITAVPKEGK